MNTDPTRRPEGADDPVAIGEGLRPVEDRLRRGLAAEAATVSPGDRLGVILTEARTAPGRPGTRGADGPTGPGGRPHRWLLPVAAASAAVLVAGGVWAATRGGSPTPPVAGQPTTSVASTSAPSASSTPSSSQPSAVPTQTAHGPSSPAAPPATTIVGVPVYYVGPLTAASSGAADLRLFREFVRTSVPTPTGPEARALAALGLAMGRVPSSSRYVSPWAGVTPVSVVLDGSGRIVVTLSGGLPGGAAASADVAVQQLVWTAQAGVGQGTKPVVLVVQGGGDVAPGIPSGRAHQRPGDAMGVYDVLSPLWVDAPARGATLRAGQRVTVTGVASTFEANVEWQLLRPGGDVVATGSTTAAAGAPERGAYSFRTKALPAGDYVVRVLESSPKDGSTDAEQLIPFTVR